MRERSVRLVRNFLGALGHGVLQELDLSDVLAESPEGLGSAVAGVLGILCSVLLVGLFFCMIYGFFQIGYELMFDPNSTDVATRLTGISINPEKWI